MCDFQPGDVVVCVNGGDRKRPESLKAVLVEGATYNVREIVEGRRPDGERGTGVHLSQPETRWTGGNGRRGAWDHERFRRVYRPKADLISKLLEPVELGERA